MKRFFVSTTVSAFVLGAVSALAGGHGFAPIPVTGAGIYNDAPITRPYLRNYDFNNGLTECRIPPVKGMPPTTPSKKLKGYPVPTLVLRGGGYEKGDEMTGFNDLVDPKKNVAIVLTASQPNSGYTPAYALDYYNRIVPNTLDAIFTRQNGQGYTQYGPLSPDSDKNVNAVNSSGGVLITGGYPANLQGLADSGVGFAILNAYLHGKPIYGNSGALSLIGAKSLSRIPPTGQPGEIGQGLGLVNATLISHFNDPRFGDMRRIFWDVVNSTGENAPPGVAISLDTLVTVKDSNLYAIPDANPRHRVYIYDPKNYPATANPRCDVWYLGTGDTYNLVTRRAYNGMAPASRGVAPMESALGDGDALVPDQSP